MSALSIQDELGMRSVPSAMWWAPEPGTGAAVVQAVVRTALLVLVMFAFLLLPGAVDTGVTALEQGLAR